jgi:5-methylthioadenosine/S-adenosylhomocysteine deaminase
MPQSARIARRRVDAIHFEAVSLLVRNATVVTMNESWDVIEGDVSVRDGRIAAIGGEVTGSHDRVIDARGDLLLPGFVQTHVHLCQTLFRGYADDLALMDWLRQRVWPMEAAHTESSLRASARLAACELVRGGTTSILTMETVYDTDAVCDEIAQSGLRATIAKCMMDDEEDVPGRLREKTRESIDQSLALHARWHGAAEGRLRIAFAPRFVPSCSRELLEAVGSLSAEHGVLIHTHASESPDEGAIVRDRTGMDNVPYLVAMGLASPRLCAAHCVWVDDTARALLAEHEVKVLHCPGSNLKLGSGLAPIVELREAGVTISLGADGAACNNRLDMFDEMRLAVLIQSVRLGPGRLRARDALEMATRGGAKTLGLENDIGSIELGKKGDLALVERRDPHIAPNPDIYSAVVYSGRAQDVRATIIDGQLLVDEGRLTRMDRAHIAVEAGREARQLAVRAGLA